MKPLCRRSHVLLLLSLMAMLCATHSSGAQKVPTTGVKPGVNDLAWLAGAWEMKRGSSITEENWTAPAGGLMLGTSRTVVNGKAVFFEFLRIEERADGVYYVAHPKARPGTDFKLKTAAASEVAFENLQHDFPKRIIYRKNADGSVTARIEGDGTEKEKPQEFHFSPKKTG